jgi:hypothetical protein
MLTAIPRHWFSWDFTLFEKDRSLAEIDMSAWREKGELTVTNTTYRVYREGLFSGAFILEGNGAVVARAEKPSAMTRRVVLNFGSTQFELKPRSTLFFRTFHLLSGKRIVGTLSPRGFLSRRMDIELSDDIPLPIKVFVVWLTVLLWKRDSDGG